MMKESSSGLVIIPIIVNCRLTIYPPRPAEAMHPELGVLFEAYLYERLKLGHILQYLSLYSD